MRLPQQRDRRWYESDCRAGPVGHGLNFPGAPKRTGWDKALAVREVLKFDFFFAGRAEFADEFWNQFAIMIGRSHNRSEPLDTEEAARSPNESELLVLTSRPDRSSMPTE